jgi:hypothetical protein
VRGRRRPLAAAGRRQSLCQRCPPGADIGIRRQAYARLADRVGRPEVLLHPGDVGDQQQVVGSGGRQVAGDDRVDQC